MSYMLDTDVLEDFYVAWKRRQNRLRRHAIVKGIPVSGTGKRSNMGHFRDGAGRSSGVMGGSRLFPYRYKDEGDYGPIYRREIRRAERVQWLSEYNDECRSELDEMAAFGSWE